MNDEEESILFQPGALAFALLVVAESDKKEKKNNVAVDAAEVRANVAVEPSRESDGDGASNQTPQSPPGIRIGPAKPD